MAWRLIKMSSRITLISTRLTVSLVLWMAAAWVKTR